VETQFAEPQPADKTRNSNVVTVLVMACTLLSRLKKKKKKQ
jgi:hypothetical protein